MIRILVDDASKTYGQGIEGLMRMLRKMVDKVRKMRENPMEVS